MGSSLSLGSLAHAGIFGFIHGGWVDYPARSELLGSSSVVGFTRAHPRGRWVHPRSLGSLTRALGVFGFIGGRWVHSQAPSLSLGSSEVVGFTRARTGVVGFVRCSWVHSRAL